MDFSSILKMLGSGLGDMSGGYGAPTDGGGGGLGALLGRMQTNPVASKMPMGGTNYAADPFAGGGQKQDFGAMLRQFLGNLQ